MKPFGGDTGYQLSSPGIVAGVCWKACGLTSHHLVEPNSSLFVCFVQVNSHSHHFSHKATGVGDLYIQCHHGIMWILHGGSYPTNSTIVAGIATAAP